MSKKADIAISRGEGDKLVVTPDPFVLRKGVTQIRIRNDSDTDVQLDLREVPVKQGELRIAAGATASVPVKRTLPKGPYSYGVSAAPPVHRRDTEASPKIIAESSPKIIVEASPKIIVEGSTRSRPRTTRRASSL
jgi:hypothetical protein